MQIMYYQLCIPRIGKYHRHSNINSKVYTVVNKGWAHIHIDTHSVWELVSMETLHDHTTLMLTQQTDALKPCMYIAVHS